MNTRTTLFLVILVAAVGAFVFWDHSKGTTTQQRQAKSKRILEFSPQDITGIDLVHSNQTIGLLKAGDDWQIKQPLIARADEGAVSAILDELEFAERSRTITEAELKGVSLVDYGLDVPRGRVTLHSKKRPVGLLIGRETPTKDALYVQVEGRKEVYVTRKSVWERLSTGLDSLRSRSAIEFSPAATSRIEIKTAERVVELSKSTGTTNGLSRWALTRPLAVRADQNKVSELLTDLNTLRIQDFVSDDPKDVHSYQLEEPEREVSVFAGDTGKTLALGKALTNDAAKVYAKLKPGNSIFTVSADVAKKFSVQINELRDARVLPFSAAEIKGIEIARGSNIILLNRTDTGWRLAPAPAEAAAVDRFLDGLGNLRATQFVADVATDLDRYGLATPSVTVSLLSDGTNVVTQLLVGGLDAGGAVRYVKNAGEPFIYGITPSAVENIPTQYGAFRSRLIFNLNPAQATKLVAGDVTVTRDAQGKWQLGAPAQGVLDAESIRHVLQLFCQLRADRFDRAKTEADVTLGYRIEVAFGDKTHWVSLTKDGLAAADECELTFQLQPAVVQTLTKSLVTTNAPPASSP